MKISKKEMNEKIDQLLTGAFTSPEGAKRLEGFYHIDADLYQYSFYNQLLIALQGGTICQSFQNWKKNGRYVKQGEKASIGIFKPMFARASDPDEEETGEEKETKKIQRLVVPLPCPAVILPVIPCGACPPLILREYVRSSGVSYSPA